MPYTSHGHWYGPGKPTLPAPAQRARCGGLSMCRICIKEATPSGGTYNLSLDSLNADQAQALLRRLRAEGYTAEYV
ncbi:hypothetical protein [Streptosporangium jomthongense]|uniref:HMA domain-containing protein n=1 Tax=Streptosporangium jomthongense TaxID=1193683 RepID=A0ABV8FGU0_9ACTN